MKKLIILGFFTVMILGIIFVPSTISALKAYNKGEFSIISKYKHSLSDYEALRWYKDNKIEGDSEYNSDKEYNFKFTVVETYKSNGLSLEKIKSDTIEGKNKIYFSDN